MAVTKYITNAGGGAHDGSSVANAYTLAELLTYLAGATISSDHYLRFCGDFALTGAFSITKDGAYNARIFAQGWNAGGTAQAKSTWAYSSGGTYNGIDGITSDYWSFSDICVSGVNGYGWNITANADDLRLINCGAVGCFDNGFNLVPGAGPVYLQHCYSTGNDGYGFVGYSSGQYLVDCYAQGNGNYGFVGLTVTNCIADGNTGAGFSNCFCLNCTEYDNSTYGFLFNAIGASVMCINCLSVRTTSGSSFAGGGTNRVGYMLNSASYNGGSSVRQSGVGVFYDDNPIVLSANPLNNAGIASYGLNRVTGGGELCRKYMSPFTFAQLLNTQQRRDIGAINPIRPSVKASNV